MLWEPGEVLRCSLHRIPSHILYTSYFREEEFFSGKFQCKSNMMRTSVMYIKGAEADLLGSFIAKITRILASMRIQAKMTVKTYVSNLFCATVPEYILIHLSVFYLTFFFNKLEELTFKSSAEFNLCNAIGCDNIL